MRRRRRRRREWAERQVVVLSEANECLVLFYVDIVEHPIPHFCSAFPRDWMRRVVAIAQGDIHTVFFAHNSLTNLFDLDS